MSQQLTWVRSEQNEERFRHHLVRALVRSGVCVTVEDANSNYLFIANLPDFWSLKGDEEPRDDMLFTGGDLVDRLAALKESVRDSDEAGRLEINDGHERIFEFVVEPIETGEAKPGLMTTIIDLSEERRREALLKSLLREVSHRSKNLLAIIQSIASQTAKHTSKEGFLQKFSGRLHSLSKSQDLITDSSWRGAHVKDLVRDQVAKYTDDNAQAINIEGDNLLLTPNASLHIGLAVHELIVNALSYGTPLTGPSVHVRCGTVEEDGEKLNEFVWEEHRAPGKREQMTGNGAGHFGSTVLQRVVPGSVNGTAEYEITDEHVLYRLTFPPSTAG